MIYLKDKKLNKELKRLEDEKLPSVEEIKQENRILKQKEEKFKARFSKK